MIVPVADAAALYMLTQKGGSFGTMRSLATLGYLAGLLASGFLIGHFGAWLFLPLFVGLSLLRAAGSFQIPRFKSGLKTDLNHVHHFSHFLQPWLMLPLLGWSMVYATHLVLNGFQSLLWSQQGYSTVMISVLIGFGALSEAIAFYLFKHVHLKLDARWIILMSGVVSVFRWLAMAQEPAMIWLIPLQLLHGITFALGFLACVNYIGSNSNVKVAAEAQSFFLVLQQISGIIVISIFSWLASTTGSGAFYGSAAIALVGTVLIGATMQFSKSEAMPQV